MYKHIKTASFILAAAFVFMLFGIYQHGKQMYFMSRGNYFFEQTRNNTNIQTIVLSFPQEQTISLIKKDGFWRIKEADDYFAAFSKINILVNLIRSTTIYRADLLDGKNVDTYFQDKVGIQSYDGAGKLIDDAVISSKHQNNKYHYAALNGNNILYQLNGNFALSPYVMDWVQMPILKIEYSQIKRIVTDNFETYCQFSGGQMLNADTGEDASHVSGLISNLWYLSAEEIRHAVHFNREAYQKVRSYEITLFNGVIYKLDFYSNKKEYWINIHLEREKIISDTAAQLLKENGILYDGWFFKLNFSNGEAIVEFVL